VYTTKEFETCAEILKELRAGRGFEEDKYPLELVFEVVDYVLYTVTTPLLYGETYVSFPCAFTIPLPWWRKGLWMNLLGEDRKLSEEQARAAKDKEKKKRRNYFGRDDTEGSDSTP